MLLRLVFSTCVLSYGLSLAGCGGSDPINVVDHADQKSIDEYRALVAQEEAAYSGSEEGLIESPTNE